MKTTIKHGPESCRSDPPTFTIETVKDYALAKHRIKALSAQDGSSFRELVALQNAVRVWEMSHPDIRQDR
jgi:hypothetical protein